MSDNIPIIYTVTEGSSTVEWGAIAFKQENPDVGVIPIPSVLYPKPNPIISFEKFPIYIRII